MSDLAIRQSSDDQPGSASQSNGVFSFRSRESQNEERGRIYRIFLGADEVKEEEKEASVIDEEGDTGDMDEHVEVKQFVFNAKPNTVDRGIILRPEATEPRLTPNYWDIQVL